MPPSGQLRKHISACFVFFFTVLWCSNALCPFPTVVILTFSASHLESTVASPLLPGLHSGHYHNISALRNVATSPGDSVGLQRDGWSAFIILCLCLCPQSLEVLLRHPEDNRNQIRELAQTLMDGGVLDELIQHKLDVFNTRWEELMARVRHRCWDAGVVWGGWSRSWTQSRTLASITLLHSVTDTQCVSLWHT